MVHDQFFPFFFIPNFAKIKEEKKTELGIEAESQRGKMLHSIVFKKKSKGI